MGAAARCGELLSSRLQSSHAKVDQLDCHGISIQQYVLRLEVAVVNIDSVAVDQGCDDLAEDMYSVDFDQAALFVDVTEELAAFNKLHDEVADTCQI